MEAGSSNNGSSNNNDISVCIVLFYIEKQLYNLTWPSHKPNEVVWEALVSLFYSHEIQEDIKCLAMIS
jgi:hypothetical protein